VERLSPFSESIDTNHRCDAGSNLTRGSLMNVESPKKLLVPLSGNDFSMLPLLLKILPSTFTVSKISLGPAATFVSGGSHPEQLSGC
jgi:hypothetical protein